MTTDHLYDPIGDVIRPEVLRELPVQLTDQERLQIAEYKAAAEQELEALSKRAAEVRREHVERMKDLERRIAEMGVQVKDRKQSRVVICYERWADGEIEIVRRDIDPRDPSSVIDRRSATIEEAQRALTGVDAEPAKERKRK